MSNMFNQDLIDSTAPEEFASNMLKAAEQFSKAIDKFGQSELGKLYLEMMLKGESKPVVNPAEEILGYIIRSLVDYAAKPSLLNYTEWSDFYVVETNRYDAHSKQPVSRSMKMGYTPLYGHKDEEWVNIDPKLYEPILKRFVEMRLLSIDSSGTGVTNWVTTTTSKRYEVNRRLKEQMNKALKTKEDLAKLIIEKAAGHRLFD